MPLLYLLGIAGDEKKERMLSLPLLNSAVPYNTRSIRFPELYFPPSVAAFGKFSCNRPRYITRSSSVSSVPKAKKDALHEPYSSSAAEAEEEEEEEESQQDQDFLVLTAMRSNFNDIVIVETPKSKMLLLDSTHNIHSIFNKDQKWTGSYWDEFASLPAIVPEGPIAIYGLGGGTAAHLMLELWPSLQLEGWEIDEILIDKAREHLGLSDIENCTQDGGILNVRVGDVLSTSANIPGRYAGIVIDLFSEGKVLQQLQEAMTWVELNNRLMPNGRLMVNCGGSIDGTMHPKTSSTDGSWLPNSTIKALWTAFPGQLNWKKLPEKEGSNYLALTGPLPDLNLWSSTLPDRLSSSVKQWKSYE